VTIEPIAERPPTELYHATASVNRDSIQKVGLILNATEGDAVHSITGGFFFCSKPPEPAEKIDVWVVDITGLNLQIDDTDIPFDPEDTWWVTYDRKVIEPWRLRLLDDGALPD
jgi:hypothetical protein